MVDNYDWYFLPVINGDGYEYCWTEDRLWRKSRRTNPGSSCIGTDINRNFDFTCKTDPEKMCLNKLVGRQAHKQCPEACKKIKA